MPSENWGNQKNWPQAETKIMNEDTLKSKLDDMSLKQLKGYAKDHDLKAESSSKEELKKEILEEVK